MDQAGMFCISTARMPQRESYLLVTVGAGLALAGTGGAGAILLLWGCLAGSILSGAGSSGVEKQEQGWGWG